MPQFEPVESAHGILGVTIDQVKEVAARQRSRIRVERQNPYAAKASRENQVYIYNVSPWPRTEVAGSMGTFYFPGIPEDKVLGDDLYVAGPCIIPGIPTETYPIEDGTTAKRMDHTPPEGLPDAERPGFHFAKELCHAGVMGSNPENDLTQQGIFIAEKRGYNAVPDFPRGDMKTLLEWIRINCQHYGIKGRNFEDAEEEAARVQVEARKIYTAFRSTAYFKEWQLIVKAAQQAFRLCCERMCSRANLAQSARQFHTVNEPRLFKAARFIGKTPAECSWMEHSGDSTGSHACWSCGTVSKAPFRCPNCNVLFVSEAEWNAEVARRAKGTAA